VRATSIIIEKTGSGASSLYSYGSSAFEQNAVVKALNGSGGASTYELWEDLFPHRFIVEPGSNSVIEVSR
jgi:hypothetical protein